MEITITDPELVAQIKASLQIADLRGPDGEYLGQIRKPWGVPPPGFKVPISDEEFERRRREEKDGLSLDEAWEEIKRRYP